jgi:hypothetical protein
VSASLYGHLINAPPPLRMGSGVGFGTVRDDEGNVYGITDIEEMSFVNDYSRIRITAERLKG